MPSNERAIHIRCFPQGAGFEQSGEITLKINGVRYVPLRLNGALKGYYEAVDENNITQEQQQFFDYHWPCLEIDNRVYVVGMRSLLDTGYKSSYVGCYLGTVRCYGENRFVSRGGQITSRETWERNVLGPIPSAFNGGLVIDGTVDMSQVQVKHNAEVFGQYHGGGDVKALDSTHSFLNIGPEWDEVWGVHCELMDDWYNKYTADDGGDGRHYDCFINALTTRGAEWQWAWSP